MTQGDLGADEYGDAVLCAAAARPDRWWAAEDFLVIR